LHENNNDDVVFDRERYASKSAANDYEK